jgi:hypothetical protein
MLRDRLFESSFLQRGVHCEPLVSSPVSGHALGPDEARSFFDLVGHRYLPGPAMRDFDYEYRAITHAHGARHLP